MTDMQLLDSFHRAGQEAMRQRILDFIANLVDLSEDQQETNILHEVLTAVSEEVQPAPGLDAERLAIQQAIAAAELDAAASRMFRN